MSEQGLFIFVSVAIIWSMIVTATVIGITRRIGHMQEAIDDVGVIAEQAGLAAIEANPSRVDQIASEIGDHLRQHEAREMRARGALNDPTATVLESTLDKE